MYFQVLRNDFLTVPSTELILCGTTKQLETSTVSLSIVPVKRSFTLEQNSYTVVGKARPEALKQFSGTHDCLLSSLKLKVLETKMERSPA